MRQQNHTQMPKGSDFFRMVVGVFGIGTSGPLIALSSMPIPALIFWRNLGGAIATLPLALRKKEWAKEHRSGLGWSFVAGIALGLHFFGFFIAMRYTSVAAGVALTALQPIFAALFLKLLGSHIPTKAWVGMTVSLLGVLLITGVDFSISIQAFLGDVAAIIGAALAAIYVMFGAKARETVSTASYTTVAYLASALVALPVVLILGNEMFNFQISEWFIVFGLIVGAQLLGHSMFNSVLKRVSPAVVSLIVFFEVPVGAILAFWWLGQAPPLGVIPGIVLILLGCAIVVLRTEISEELK
ncbi:MAG: DMT family transporter [Candidatus Nanopelagicales bacterium]